VEVFLALHAVGVLTYWAVELGLDVSLGNFIYIGTIRGGAAGEVVADYALLDFFGEVEEVLNVWLGDGLAALLEGTFEERDAHCVLVPSYELDDAVLMEDVLAVVESGELFSCCLLILKEVRLHADLAVIRIVHRRVFVVLYLLIDWVQFLL
jgi:hypothetical protein